MKNTNCRNVRREIEEAAPDDRLSSDAREHLMTCGACELLSREQAKLQAIVSSLGTVAVPGDFDIRLRARLAGEKRQPSQPFAFGGLSLGRNLRFGPGAVALATILLVIGTALVFMNFRAGPDNQLSAGTPKGVSNHGPSQTGIDGGKVTGAIEAGAPEVALGSQGNEENANAGTEASIFHRPSRRDGFKGKLASARDSNRISTSDLSSTPAPVLKRFDQIAETYPTSAFPINASYQSLKVSVDNGRGSSRTISLPTVSFGSQQALSQSASALMASARGAW